MSERRAAPAPVSVTGLVTDRQIGQRDEYYIVLQVSRETFEALLPAPTVSGTTRGVGRSARRAHAQR